jgi:hypothetical protein
MINQQLIDSDNVTFACVCVPIPAIVVCEMNNLLHVVK